MRFLLLLCFLIGLSPLRAQQADSIQFSLLTCIQLWYVQFPDT